MNRANAPYPAGADGEGRGATLNEPIIDGTVSLLLLLKLWQ
jgi:hypothetical protein